jgi:hypothetical protein
MSTIIEQQKEMVQTIFKHIQKEKDALDKLYSDFINKLNEGNPSNKSYTDIDELFISTVPQAKSFYDSWIKNNNIDDESDNDNDESDNDESDNDDDESDSDDDESDSDDDESDSDDSNKKYEDIKLLYWYDMNEKQFISPISGYNHKIIKKYNFEIYLEDKLFHDKSVVDKITIPFLKWELRNNIDFSYFNGGLRISSSNFKIKNVNKINQLYNQIDETRMLENYIYDFNGSKGLGDTTIGYSSISFYKNDYRLLTIILDDHLNIIIPEIKTILVNNYSSFPIYSLYSIYQKLDMSEVKVFNKHNSNDNEKYNKITNVISFQNYITSEDERKYSWSHGNKFQYILDFIGYQDIIDSIKPQLDFMQLISVNKPVEKVEVPKKELVQEGMSYDTILFNQIKDLQSQVENYKKQVSKLEKEKEEISVKNNEMQSRMKQFLGL